MCSLDLQMRVSIFEMLVASLGPSPYCAVDQGISYLKWWLWSTDRDKNPRIFSVLMQAKYFVGVGVLWGELFHMELFLLFISQFEVLECFSSCPAH